MAKKFLTILLLLTVMVGSVSAQRGKRAIKRIDRDVQSQVFIPKGTWMAGGTVSYSEHDESNLNFLVIKDVEGKGYDFNVSPYVGYFFRDNIAAGFRFAYNRDYLDLGNLDMDSRIFTTWSTNMRLQAFCVLICPSGEARSLAFSTRPV